MAEDTRKYEDISKYTFDFKTEATALLHRLGATGGHFIFLNLHVTPPEVASTPAEVKLLEAIRGDKIDSDHASIRQNLIVEFYKNGNDPNKKDSNDPNKDYTSALGPGTMFQPKTSGKISRIVGEDLTKVIALRNHSFYEELGKENAALMRLWTMRHESGHAISPNINQDKHSAPDEVKSDAFAALSFLQQFGRGAIPFISQMSALRAMHGMYGDAHHLSSFALDKIVIDYERKGSSKLDALSRLSPEETMKLAEAYAKKWTPKTAVLERAEKSLETTLKELGPDGKMSKFLESTFLSSNYVVGYASKKIGQLYADHPDALYNGKQLEFTDKQQGSMKHMKGMWLTGVFAKAAARLRPASPANMLRTRLSPGQQFSWKPSS